LPYNFLSNLFTVFPHDISTLPPIQHVFVRYRRLFYPIVQQAPRSPCEIRISELFSVGPLCRNGEVSKLFGTGSFSKVPTSRTNSSRHPMVKGSQNNGQLGSGDSCPDISMDMFSSRGVPSDFQTSAAESPCAAQYGLRWQPIYTRSSRYEAASQ